MQKHRIKGLTVLVASASLFGAMLPATTANASFWQMKYRSGWYKVRVKKTTKVSKIKYGKASYLNKIVGTKTVHKGSIVKIGYLGRDGFDWLIKSPHKYKWTSKYAYSAHFKKNSFTVIRHYR